MRRIVTHGENHIEAVRGDEVVAIARRQSRGSLWGVTLMDDPSPAPHVKVSRRLPPGVQRKLVVAILGQA